MNKILVSTLALMLFTSLGINAKTQKNGKSNMNISLDRNPPVAITPIVIGDYQLEQNTDFPGFLFKYSKKRELVWIRQVYPAHLMAGLETDVQDVFFTSMKLDEKKVGVEIVSEAGKSFHLDAIASNEPFQWPVKINFIKSEIKDAKWFIILSLEISNPGNKVLSLDGVSVAESGAIENSIFAVSADGKEIPYMGMMKKRGPPSSFVKVKPGKKFETKVSLFEDYSIPSSAKTVKITFSTKNHFSPDNVDLVSNELVINF